jgi:hypothetical protein
MSGSSDDKLDVTAGSTQAGSFKGRPFISVTFACCSVYQRIYRNAEGTAYIGRCPRCARSVRFDVGPGGTSERNFVVS